MPEIERIGQRADVAHRRCVEQHRRRAAPPLYSAGHQDGGGAQRGNQSGNAGKAGSRVVLDRRVGDGTEPQHTERVGGLLQRLVGTRAAIDADPAHRRRELTDQRCVEDLLLAEEPERATGGAEHGPDAEGWFRTGDVGYLDADGDLHLVDRASDLIIVNGFNVYPHEVERALLEHPAIAQAAVVGVPHEKWGEVVVACIRPRPGRTVDPEDLKARCAQSLSGYKRPRAVLMHDGPLPRNPTGKLLKRELRPWAAERVNG